MEFVAEPGGEYFIYIQPKEQTLTLVSIGEGEDGIANSEPVKND